MRCAHHRIFTVFRLVPDSPEPADLGNQPITSTSVFTLRTSALRCRDQIVLPIGTVAPEVAICVIAPVTLPLTFRLRPSTSYGADEPGLLSSRSCLALWVMTPPTVPVAVMLPGGDRAQHAPMPSSARYACRRLRDRRRSPCVEPSRCARPDWQRRCRGERLLMRPTLVWLIAPVTLAVALMLPCVDSCPPRRRMPRNCLLQHCRRRRRARLRDACR